jgi:hypothetical protein|tara:strand:+ start:624 stop:1325 length:702 start_codon:yes stop_codon:yes gene_type:complete
MALPKINTAPKYEAVVPSTKQTVRFRPYLVKEEKVLMMAMETQDQKQAMAAVVDTIEACVSDPIEKNKLTTFDVEYLFTRIRAKSVGETVKAGLKCESCEHPNEMVIPIEEVTIDVPDIDNKLEIADNINLVMRWPRYNDITDLSDFKSQTEMTFAMIERCIESVETAEEKIMFKDESAADRQAFIESLSGDQFTKLREFMEAMPQMKHTLEFKCGKCGHDNNVELQGMQDFL